MRANYSTNEEKNHGARILGEIYSYILAWTGPFEYETTSTENLGREIVDVVSETEVRDELEPTPK